MANERRRTDGLVIIGLLFFASLAGACFGPRDGRIGPGLAAIALAITIAAETLRTDR